MPLLRRRRRRWDARRRQHRLQRDDGRRDGARRDLPRPAARRRDHRSYRPSRRRRKNDKAPLPRDQTRPRRRYSLPRAEAARRSGSKRCSRVGAEAAEPRSSGCRRHRARRALHRARPCRRRGRLPLPQRRPEGPGREKKRDSTAPSGLRQQRHYQGTSLCLAPRPRPARAADTDEARCHTAATARPRRRLHVQPHLRNRRHSPPR
mmetsp:Transcript_25611/g.82941  ORF Transcript_25611/g.82941 Transcript_25611/m.82941 type:complete len:206 (-) Transcript_25611:26-643(-)